MVFVETDTAPKFDKNEMLDAEGVFLQAVQYEDAKGVTRRAPSSSASALADAPGRAPRELSR